jgi:hypothetical protein
MDTPCRISESCHPNKPLQRVQGAFDTSRFSTLECTLLDPSQAMISVTCPYVADYQVLLMFSAQSGSDAVLLFDDHMRMVWMSLQ